MSEEELKIQQRESWEYTDRTRTKAGQRQKEEMRGKRMRWKHKKPKSKQSLRRMMAQDNQQRKVKVENDCRQDAEDMEARMHQL